MTLEENLDLQEIIETQWEHVYVEPTGSLSYKQLMEQQNQTVEPKERTAVDPQEVRSFVSPGFQQHTSNFSPAQTNEAASRYDKWPEDYITSDIIRTASQAASVEALGDRNIDDVGPFQNFHSDPTQLSEQFTNETSNLARGECQLSNTSSSPTTAGSASSLWSYNPAGDCHYRPGHEFGEYILNLFLACKGLALLGRYEKYIDVLSSGRFPNPIKLTEMWLQIYEKARTEGIIKAALYDRVLEHIKKFCDENSIPFAAYLTIASSRIHWRTAAQYIRQHGENVLSDSGLDIVSWQEAEPMGTHTPGQHLKEEEKTWL